MSFTGPPPANADELREQALVCFEQAIRADPTYTRAFVERSAARYFGGDEQGSREDARAALKLGDVEIEDYSMLAAPFEGEESRQILRAGLKRAGMKHVMAQALWFHIANTYWYEGRFQEEINELRKIMKQFPDANYWGFIGSAQEALGDYQAAEASYRKDPSEAREIVRCRMHAGDLPGALAALEEFHAKIPELERELFRAAIDILQGQPTANPSSLASRVNPKKIGGCSQFFRGLLWKEAGQVDRARQDLMDFVERNEGNPREWGVTMRWETKRAREFLTKLPNR